MITQNAKYGLTGPLTMNKSEKKGKSEILEVFLTKQQIYETEEELIGRERVLGKLSYLFEKFVKKMMKIKNISNAKNSKSYGKIYTFGSYRLGVHTRGADIDTICVAPRFVDRESFFKEFSEILTPHFTIEKIEDAYVPLMQLVYKEKEDFLFAENISDESSNKIQSKNLLSNVEPVSISSDSSSKTLFQKRTEIDDGSSAKRIKKGGDLTTISDGDLVLNKKQKTKLKKIKNDKSVEKEKQVVKFIVKENDPEEIESNSRNIRHNENKFRVNNKMEIKIDLVFARLNISRIDSNLNLSDSTLLKNLDEKSVLSLNGNRVADDVLNLVPNILVFHGALRCIKYWSKRRQINGHAFGYFGGIAYAICVARICQLFPNFDQFGIVQKFFELYREWKWPMPVMLRKIENLNYNFKVWDPKMHPSDKFHKMPVITPSYPSMCATHNIFNSTMKRMKEELDRGHKLLEGDVDWKEFFKQTDFFQKYKSFLACFIIHRNKNAESLQNNKSQNIFQNDNLINFKMWQGHINSRLRFLCSKLETIEQCESAPPFPQVFEISSFISDFKVDKNFQEFKNFLKDDDFCSIAFIGLDFTETKQIIKKKNFLDEPIEEFKEMANDWDKKNGSEDLVIKVMKRRDINILLKKLHGFEQNSN